MRVRHAKKKTMEVCDPPPPRRQKVLFQPSYHLLSLNVFIRAIDFK